MVFIACMHLALFLALSLSPGNSVDLYWPTAAGQDIAERSARPRRRQRRVVTLAPSVHHRRTRVVHRVGPGAMTPGVQAVADIS